MERMERIWAYNINIQNIRIQKYRYFYIVFCNKNMSKLYYL